MQNAGTRVPNTLECRTMLAVGGNIILVTRYKTRVHVSPHHQTGCKMQVHWGTHDTSDAVLVLVSSASLSSCRSSHGCKP